MGKPRNFTVKNNKLVMFEDRRIYRNTDKPNNPEFFEICEILEGDNDAYEVMEAQINAGYIDMIKICKVKEMRINKDVQDITKAKLRDFQGGNIDHKYISYEMNETANTFGELFNFKLVKGINRSNVKNACFFNAIINTFKSSFDKQNEKKEPHLL